MVAGGFIWIRSFCASALLVSCKSIAGMSIWRLNVSNIYTMPQGRQSIPKSEGDGLQTMKVWRYATWIFFKILVHWNGIPSVLEALIKFFLCWYGLQTMKVWRYAIRIFFLILIHWNGTPSVLEALIKFFLCWCNACTQVKLNMKLVMLLWV
jgi:hypothetical protein